MKKGNNQSLSAAVGNLKRMFANNLDSDTVTLEDIFVATGREGYTEERNRSWLSNKTTHLYYKNLVKPVYSYDGRKKLEALKLTIDGKKALGRIESDTDETSESSNQPTLANQISMNDVAKVVKAFRDNNPEFEVVFDVKLKEVS